MDRSPAYRRPNMETDNHGQTTYVQFKLINSPNNQVFGLWEETEVPWENPLMQTPQRKAGAEIWTSNLLAVSQQYQPPRHRCIRVSFNF